MTELTEKELDEILKESVSEQLKLDKPIRTDNIEDFLNTHIKKKAVLGFDIYRYSQFDSLRQTLIPHLFKKLYHISIKNCLKNEQFFLEYKNLADFENRFIDTGDGGFQIFDTPIEAVIFAIYFQANIVRYNSGNQIHSDLHNLVGEISLRYSLTYDNVYCYKKNHYGPAIINCARIMSKDKLNRFLIDDNTIIWFNSELNSIETCQLFEAEKDFPTIPIFKDKFNKESYKSILFGKTSNNIKRLDILKIGEIKSKTDILSIYSAHFQVSFGSRGKDFVKFLVTLGNLNSSGLSE
ncbi:hypothetical protein ABIB40_003504 [Pedobacter sp. UYP30]|uniref:hypothetical protein n=1 Tax=Pedobacter sp. UYP30 TaxID=1756400 RepID=UPI00339598D8